LAAFSVADQNGDGRLSYSEARAQLPGLTRGQFDALDTNQDNLLSRAELGDIVPPPAGCPGAKSGGPGGWSDLMGDLFLLGAAMLTLVAWSAARTATP
jgi:hypothetical protein